MPTAWMRFHIRTPASRRRTSPRQTAAPAPASPAVSSKERGQATRHAYAVWKWLSELDMP
ncbi:hypothetical protein Pmi06nite_27470 [Planotetraspora mira]|uniref:Uncharacterized protein n=1 Tax=Planotetraspora mira TaxID=58121 RepID=A0A8J3TLK1_9ACTN|nr:hypothetical protein Pmi06nite_27470 [Planotetraspora mira]